ncbi:MAG: hypothetical protein V4640_15675 [Verrucomicrobiota bacterium]
MKILPSAALLLAGITVGLTVGKLLFSSSSAPREDSETTAVPTRSSPLGRSSGTRPEPTGITKIRQAPTAELGSLAQLAMSKPDPVEKRRLLTECLLNMTADNWSDVVSGFGKLSAETGRDFFEDWKLALFRSGQVAGEDAMNAQLAAGLEKKKNESWNILYGWSTKDPDAALDWLRKAEAAGHKISDQNYSAVIAGAALSHPEDALSRLAEIPPQSRKACVGNLVWNVLENGGTAALDDVMHYASRLDANDSDSAELSDGLFSEITEKLLWKADHARDVGQACDVVVKLAGFGLDPTRTTLQALQKYRYYYMPDKLNMIETVNAAPLDSEINLSSLTSTVLSTMNGDGDRAAVREWMNQHPASPLIPYLKPRVGENP